MRADLSTSGRAAVPNERGLEAASDPARIAAPNLSRLAVFLVVTLTTTWLAFLPMIMDVVARSPRLASSCCWSASAHPASQPSCSPPPMTVATGSVGWGVAASGGGFPPGGIWCWWRFLLSPSVAPGRWLLPRADRR